MAITNLKTEQIEILKAPEGFLEGLFGRAKHLVNLITKDSVMEAGFVEGLTEEKGSPINYDSIGSIVGSRIRDAFVDPLKNAGEAIEKGMTGQQISIKDLLAITELNMDLAAGGGFTSAIGKKGLNPNVITSFPAFHGSPHSFKKFADKAIGTGEGAQAFGRGHYVTESKGVAKGYSKLGRRKAKKISPLMYKNKPIEEVYSYNPKEPSDWAFGFLVENSDYLPEDPDFAEKAIKQLIEEMKTPEDYGLDKEFGEEVLKFAKNLDEKDFTPAIMEDFSENLYKTTVHKGKDPSEYTYMDWHKPVSQQKEKVIKQLEKDGILEHIEENNVVTLADYQTYYEGKLVDENAFDADEEVLAQVMLGNAMKIDPEMSKKEIFEEAFSMLENEFGNEEAKEMLSAFNKVDLDKLEIKYPEPTGEDIYHAVTEKLGYELQIKNSAKRDQAATDYLKSLGISGIQYDAGTISGGVKPGTKNYVVFDPEDITIEKHFINEELQP